jgi:hypothetical protein
VTSALCRSSRSTCTQHDIDAWFAQPAAIRRVVRPFLAWARRHRHLAVSLQLPPSHRREPSTPRDAELRWDYARRLVDDDTLDPADRVAGALVVLYAQPLTRIATLTTAGAVLPVGDDRIDDAPALLDLIGADEQCGVAD